MENLLSHAGIFFTMAAVLTFEAILLRLASEPEGGREVKARKGGKPLGGHSYVRTGTGCCCCFVR